MVLVRRLARDWRRGAATALSVLLAVTAFVVLTGSAQQSRLEVTATVDANYRSSYDILVRPKGSKTPIEASTGRVRPNYLSGLYGGITTVQADAVANIQGVEVSAPIAMVGQVFQAVDVPIDVTDLVGDAGPALLRFSTTEESMRGLARTPGPAGYVYVSSGVDLDLNSDDTPIVEKLPGGRTVPVCREAQRAPQGGSPFNASGRWDTQCWDRVNGSSGTGWPYKQDRFVVRVRMSFPVTVAAIDPAAEAKLTGVDQAVVTGRYLNAQDAATQNPQSVNVPAIASSRTLVDQVDRVRVERLGTDAVAALRKALSREQSRVMVGAATPVSASTFTITAQQGHAAWLKGRADAPTGGGINPDALLSPSSVSYGQRADGVLTPQTVKPDSSVWTRSIYQNVPFAAVPMAANDTGYRDISTAEANGGNLEQVPRLVTYGTFDPLKIRSFSELSKLPLETYQPPSVIAADDTTRAALKGRDLGLS